MAPQVSAALALLAERWDAVRGSGRRDDGGARCGTAAAAGTGVSGTQGGDDDEQLLASDAEGGDDVGDGDEGSDGDGDAEGGPEAMDGRCAMGGTMGLGRNYSDRAGAG